MDKKRPYYRTKAEWAESQARALRQRAHLLPHVRSADWRGIRSRMTAYNSLTEEARRFERMAERYAREGL